MFQIATECRKFNALKEIAEAKKEGKRLGEGLGVRRRGVQYGVGQAATEIEGLGLRAVQGAGATATEDGELIAGLVDGAISIDAL